MTTIPNTVTRECETCGGDGFTIEFRRFAGEYQAGEPVEITCPDCDGVEDKPVAREPYTPSAEYLAWCAEADAARAAVLDITVKTLGGERGQVWL